MRAQEIEPTITEEPSYSGETRRVLNHPAFGQIRVSRVSGQKNLYGSDFPHQHYVTLEIATSSLSRSYSNDRPFAGQPFVRIALSESQWATFVSSFNIGEGTQCTIELANGERPPGIAYRDSADEYKAETNADLKAAIDELEVLRDKLAEGTSKLSKTAAADLLQHVDQSIRKLSQSVPFIAEQFAEHMEKRREKAKIEVNAYIDQNIRQAGLDALVQSGGLGRPLLTDRGDT